MKFAVNRADIDPARDKIGEAIIKEFEEQGHVVAPIEDRVKFVLNLVNMSDLEAFKRKSQAEFVVSLVALDRNVEDLRSTCYTALVKTLSNLFLCLVPSGGGEVPEIYLITPEVGFYHYPFDARKVYENMLPIVGSRLVIRNTINTELPSPYWKTTPAVEELKHYGRVMKNLGVLPAPFPLHDVLNKEDIAHLYELFEIKGLSYGNLSVREKIPELGTSTFWMTARGVDKADLKGIGHDILLVNGYDEGTRHILVSVPPEHDPRARVSVDAIEHTLIYQTFPEVGAIVHVHAWMDGVLCTHQNYPCGTQELAEEVIALLKRTDTPACTTVGLKNHGLTITGPTFDDIFTRIEGKLQTEVPMFE
ncbi:MAG: class II aldolase/adducin family protein [candidate division WOR-3 bacterium]|nr:MAG: class II aldolase/adducin family protein [candidate division WOR-3 bacterium]